MHHLDTLIMAETRLASCREEIVKVFELLRTCFEGGNKLLVCGNGGSSADAGHIVGELMKDFLFHRPLPSGILSKLRERSPDARAAFLEKNLHAGLPAISLSAHESLLTAMLNDMNPELIFAQQVLGYGRPGDVLLAISTSGNSKNVLHAAWLAARLGLGVVALTGGSGGELKELADAAVVAPADATTLIQEFHLKIYHVLCAMLEETFFGSA